jgi:hypothetical protein
MVGITEHSMAEIYGYIDKVHRSGATLQLITVSSFSFA